jgi:hypothetical protein
MAGGDDPAAPSPVPREAQVRAGFRLGVDLIPGPLTLKERGTLKEGGRPDDDGPSAYPRAEGLEEFIDRHLSRKPRNRRIHGKPSISLPAPSDHNGISGYRQILFSIDRHSLELKASRPDGQ